MPKPWDNTMRALVRTSPQAFVSLVFPNARYIKERPEQLKNWQLEVDALLEVAVEDQKMLLHLEFQTYNDADMPERLLRYNVLAQGEYKMPVVSCVIYLLRDGPVQQPPLQWLAPTGTHIITFTYMCIEIGAFTRADILATGQTGLLPFIPLTLDGATRDSVQQMFATLESTANKELELVGFAMASLVLMRTNPEDWEWLKRRYKIMQDLLRETPIFQMIFAEGRTEGEAKGRIEGEAKGRTEGILAGRRKTLVHLVSKRFPRLQASAEQQVLHVDDPELLDNLIIDLSVAHDEQEAAGILQSLRNPE
ncbi:MAG TPA: hypothetical protein VKY19_27275 [Ktedonosporobacter sp.]|nr:hypothetical protein [Ktedonosporobacter sp.]